MPGGHPSFDERLDEVSALPVGYRLFLLVLDRLGDACSCADQGDP